MVGRPHGVRGAFHLFLHNPSSSAIQTVGSVQIARRGDGPGSPPSEHRVAAVSRSGRRCVVALEGFDRREQAEGLAGARLLVRRSALPRLEDGEVYVADLIGLEVFQAGARLGAIASSREQGGVEVLLVRGEAEEIEIPFVEGFVAAVDVAGGRLEVENTDDLPRAPLRPRSEGRV